MEKPSFCISSFCAALVLLLVLSFSIVAQTRSNITVGQSLSATNNSNSLVSPLGDFAFGFHPFLNDKNLFLLAIWYAKIPDTIVWYANEGNPVPEKSTVTLTADSGLVLNDPKGNHLWNSSGESTGTFGVVSYGLMDDTGNFILRNQEHDSVWQSFAYPTDTLLPAQIMEKGQVLESRLSEGNYTKGRFQLWLNDDGNLVLNTKDTLSDFADPPYYSSESSNQGLEGNQLVYNESGHMYLLSENGTVLNDFVPGNMLVSPRDYYQRATLNFYGVFTWYYHGKNFTNINDVGWSNMYSIPDNICNSFGTQIDSGACGFNSICTYDTNDQKPRCTCPTNYSLLDPNDEYGHCKPDFQVQVCENEQDAEKVGYELVPVKDADWPFCDYAQHNGISEEECKSSCLNDCFCAVAIYESSGAGSTGSGTCWKKKLPLSHGKQDTEVNRIAWLKVGNRTYSIEPFTPTVSPSKVKNKVNTAITVLLGGSVLFNFALLSTMVLGIFFIYNKKQPRQIKPLDDYGNVYCFSYKALEEATDRFREELGRGAFGVVYKGKITAGNSSHFVAVKKLVQISNDTDREFKAEMNVIGKTHHKNLVRLVGFCKEEDQRLLVYEYMSNGTLASYLFGDLRPNWVERVQIVLGIARGLLYLHEECSNQIIHCDIKPQNILLDAYKNARI